MARSLTLVVALGMLVFGTAPAQAHKVIASLFPSGSKIEGEIGFSNGVMAENTLVEIFDLDGNKIDEVTTDGDGFFVYTPSQQINLRFRADLGAGHVAEATFSIADLTGADEAVQTALSKRPVASGAGSNAGPAITREQEEIIATIVRDELRPLRRELTAYKEKNDLQSILGGIGYIFGAFGIIYYIAARRLRAKAPNA